MIRLFFSLVKLFCKTILITLTVVAVLALIAGLTLAVHKIEYSMNEDAWNNGICECGGKFEFVNASSVKGAGTSYTYYFYSCNDCGNVIKMDFVMREENK